MRDKKSLLRVTELVRDKTKSAGFFLTFTIEVKSLQSNMAQEVIIKVRFARLFCWDNSPFFY